MMRAISEIVAVALGGHDAVAQFTERRHGVLAYLVTSTRRSFGGRFPPTLPSGSQAPSSAHDRSRRFGLRLAGLGVRRKGVVATGHLRKRPPPNRRGGTLARSQA